MTADHQGQDPKTLWQDQEQETDPVTLEHVHNLSRRLDHKTRFTPAILALGLLFVGLVIGRVWFVARDPLSRTVFILTVVGTFACYYMVYRMQFPSRDPAEPAAAHLRRRVQRELAFARGGWTLAILLPVLPALLITCFMVLSRPVPLWLKVFPFVILGVVTVFPAMVFRWKAPKIKARLQELDELLKR
jgi:hypothetical protein